MAKSPKPPLYPDITRQLRRIPIREVPDGMFAGPPGFKDIKVRCEACGCSYAPPWTDKLKFEQSHIQSADGAKWVLAGLPFACPSCGRENDLRFDSNTPSNGLVRLFGDESSERFGHHGYLYVYVVVAIHPEWIKAIHDKLAETKLRLRPSLPPSSWPLHLLEIRDTESADKVNPDCLPLARRRDQPRLNCKRGAAWRKCDRRIIPKPRTD